MREQCVPGPLPKIGFRNARRCAVLRKRDVVVERILRNRVSQTQLQGRTPGTTEKTHGKVVIESAG